MAVITACVAGGAAALAIGGSLVQSNQASQAAKGYKNEADRRTGEIAALEKKIDRLYQIRMLILRT